MAKNKKKTQAKIKAKTTTKAKTKTKTKTKIKTKPKAKSAKPFAKAKSKAKSLVKSIVKSITKSTVTAPKKIKLEPRILSGLKLTPLDDRLLIQVEAPAEKTAGGLYIPVTVSERPSQGKVIAGGRGRRNKKGQVRPMDVGVGDTVLFAQFAGTKIEIEGNELLILREEEVLGIVNSK